MMAQNRSSWKVPDEQLCEELMILMNISAEEQQLLCELQEQARAIAPVLSTAFYGRLTNHVYTDEYLKESMIEHLHTTLQTWFIELFSGVYDTDYTRRRLKIGKVHVERGIPVRYPLAMMDVIVTYGLQVAQQSVQPDLARQAFRKVVSLDLAVFNQAYENHQLRHLADLVGGEPLARILLAGRG